MHIDGTIDNPNEICILEAKQQWNAGVKLTKNVNNVQMSTEWIKDVAKRIETEAQNLIATDPIKAQKMIDIANMIKNPANATKIKPYVVTLNRPVGGAAGTGSMNILKLNPF